MRYFGNPSSELVRAAMMAGLVDQIDTPTQNNLLPGVVWCADNACFGSSYPGDDAWFAWLTRRAVHADRCVFATAPDVVGDATATLARSRPWLPRIRALGYRAALVAQDGLEDLDVPWDAFDVLFIGGTTAWKLGGAARRLVGEAKTRGKWVHMGRVNSAKRFRYAEAIGCDSADGTTLAQYPDATLPNVLSWLRPRAQSTLTLDLSEREATA